MATFSHETVTTSRERFILRGPSNLAEFDKMASAAIKLCREQSRPLQTLSDDAIQVTVEDDAIVFSWEVSAR